jgi:hypothetical protein
MYLAHRGPVRKPPKIGGSSKGQRNIAAILYLGAKLVIEGSLTVGELAAFNMLAARVRFLAMTSRQTPIYSFTTLNTQTRSASAALDGVTAPIGTRSNLRLGLAQSGSFLFITTRRTMTKCLIDCLIMP